MRIGNYATNALNERYKININVEQVSLTVFGSVKLKKVLILDHHKDTLIYANRIKTSILDWDKLLECRFDIWQHCLGWCLFQHKNLQKGKNVESG